MITDELVDLADRAYYAEPKGDTFSRKSQMRAALEAIAPRLVEADPGYEYAVESKASIAAGLLEAQLDRKSTFQKRVHAWMLACFGEAIAADITERNHRFLEEALELVQSKGCTASEAHQLVDYVFGRDVGEVNQEAGGVLVTLAALLTPAGVDMVVAAETELARVWTKIDRIREKQAGKPRHSPLPGYVESEPPVERNGVRVRSFTREG